jgi:hypothetical protein
MPRVSGSCQITWMEFLRTISTMEGRTHGYGLLGCSRIWDSDGTEVSGRFRPKPAEWKDCRHPLVSGLGWFASRYDIVTGNAELRRVRWRHPVSDIRELYRSRCRLSPAQCCFVIGGLSLVVLLRRRCGR